jgi:hypothetical protein
LTDWGDVTAVPPAGGEDGCSARVVVVAMGSKNVQATSNISVFLNVCADIV